MDKIISPKDKGKQSEVMIMMMRYLLDNGDSDSKNIKDKNDIVEPEIEDTEIKLEEKKGESLTIQYFFDRESEEMEYHAKINLYQRRLYDELHAFSNDDESIIAEAKNEENDSYTAEEAKKTLEEVQYSSILGRDLVDNYEEYRKLDQWIMFNPAIFALFQSIYNLNREVNYRPLA